MVVDARAPYVPVDSERTEVPLPPADTLTQCRDCRANTAVRITCAGCCERVRLVAGSDGFDGSCSACNRAYEVRFDSGALG